MHMVPSTRVTPDPLDALIVALDGSPSQILEWGAQLEGVVRWVKVGMTGFYADGAPLVSALRERGFNVFLDLKMHDIPHQVEGAARSVARLGAQMVTVHASGGSAMVSAAVAGAEQGAAEAGVTRPAILAVTILTSMDGAALREMGVREEPARLVDTMARAAVAAGADGVVCSPQESSWVRAAIGNDPYIVTPGVRPTWAATDDQARTLGPREALLAGASHLVVGRPITGAGDLAAAASRVLDEMRG